MALIDQRRRNRRVGARPSPAAFAVALLALSLLLHRNSNAPKCQSLLPALVMTLTALLVRMEGRGAAFFYIDFDEEMHGFAIINRPHAARSRHGVP